MRVLKLPILSNTTLLFRKTFLFRGKHKRPETKKASAFHTPWRRSSGSELSLIIQQESDIREDDVTELPLTLWRRASAQNGVTIKHMSSKPSPVNWIVNNVTDVWREVLQGAQEQDESDVEASELSDSLNQIDVGYAFAFLSS
eukprot:Trichotokara_eunicae@DN3401_c0_g1_i1.p1